MPCLPMGISVRQGRTSILNRFRSIPRYRGASRNRMTRDIWLLLKPAPISPVPRELGTKMDFEHLRDQRTLWAPTRAGRRAQRDDRSAPSWSVSSHHRTWCFWLRNQTCLRGQISGPQISSNRPPARVLGGYGRAFIDFDTCSVRNRAIRN
jgi:hypothetical protein